MTAEPPRILVIDDDEALARLLEVAFRTTSAEVVTHSRGYGVLQLVATHRPALVVLDVMMPGLDGPSVLELLRQDPELSRTRVVLWSAMAREQLAEAAEAAGADGYLEKTVGPRELVAQVTQWLMMWDGVQIGAGAT